MIKLKKISAGYGKDTILKDLDCSFIEGEITSIIGMNGCGKSTLLKVISGLIQPVSGEIEVQGKNLLSLTDKDRAKLISYLPQSRNTPAISAERMVLHGRFPYLSYPRRYSSKDKNIAMTAMERVGILGLKDKNMSELSGGERQKVYIAMALTQDTRIILLDEPTTFLDITYQLELLKLLTELRNEGKTVITVIHDLSLALRYSNKIIVMKEGRVKYSSTPSEVYNSGILEEVFHVKAHHFMDDNKREFYYFT
jgi:ABC-type cobalamin/Fe3+-siderophores transport system ATPase subunit